MSTSKRHRHRDRAITFLGGNLHLSIRARLANSDGARADEQPGRGDALGEIAARGVSHVDDQPRRPAFGERRNLRAHLLGGAAAERRDANVADAVTLLPALHVDRLAAPRA